MDTRDNWDDRRFGNTTYQMLPTDGYTKWFGEVLNHPNIQVVLNSDFFDLRRTAAFKMTDFKRIFYTGPIDHYFANEKLPSLPYRSISFTKKTLKSEGPLQSRFAQPAVAVLYPELSSTH